MKPTIHFHFSPFDEGVLKSTHTVFIFGFQEQEDKEVSKMFPELERRRKCIDKTQSPNTEDKVLFQSIARGNSVFDALLIYISYPWKKKKEIVVESVNFLREVFLHVKLATERAKDEERSSIAVILPDRFSPKNLKDKSRRGPLYRFVRTVSEAIVYGNGPYDEYKSSKETLVTEVTFMFFGESDQTSNGFFNKAIVDGEIIGRHLVKVRQLIEMPPNVKTPLRFVSDIVEKEIKKKPSNHWRKIAVSGRVTASLLYGTKTLETHGFNLINAVNAGSRDEACILKLSYKPKTTRQKRVRRVALVGKAVLFDTGGHDLKGAEKYEAMHFDMAGGATVAAIPFLADEFNVPVEIVSLVPIVKNMIGKDATLPFSVIKAYGGKTVEIKNTDAEGRLILAETLVLAEEFNPDALISVGTLGDISDFGPDFLKVGISGANTMPRVARAKQLSAEKVLMLPPIEDLNKVDEEHIGKHSDLTNDPDPEKFYHSSPFVFLSNFLKTETPWFYVDNAALMEKDADEYGAGPSFGVKFVWYLVEQFS